jgi:hypothetical protein
VPLAEVEVDVHRVGDRLAAGDGGRHEVPVVAGESRVHLDRALEVELVRVHPHPRVVAAEAAGVDAQEDVLGLGILAVDVVAVAGGDRRDPQLAGDLQGRVGHLPLHLEAVVLDLDEVAVAERPLEPAGDLPGLGQRLALLAGGADERPAELARQTAGKADEPLTILLEQFAVDPRLEVEALEVGLRRQLEEVREAGPVAGQEREVVARVLLAAGILLEAAARGDVGLVADDRVDARGLGGLVELERPVEVAVVGDRQGVHAQFHRPRHQPVDRAGAVEQAVVAVAVEVDEGGRAHPWASRGRARL